MAVNDLITFRKGTASAWTSVNPVLASGEPGYDLTNSVLKIGDGVSNWTALSGIGSTSLNNSSSSVGVRGIISTTGTLTSFAVSGGYPVGYLDLFQDGVKLVSDLDFSATDGSNVTLSNSVPSGTVLEYLTMASGVSSGGGASSLPSNISGSLSVDGDSSYGSVVLLCHGSTASDSSSYNRTVTLNGAGVSVTGLPKYGSSSFAFTSSTSYVSVPSSSDFSFGTGDFTMESWIYPTAYPENNDGAYISTIFGRQQAGDHCYRMDLLGTASSFTGLFFNGFAANDGGQTVTVNYSFQLNTWYHIAVSRVSGILYMFINGVLQNSGGTSFTINIKESSNEARLGALNFGNPYYFQFFGYIADARITKGLGRYSSNFTPPTSELPSNAPYSLSSVSLSVSGSSGSGGSGLSWSSVPASSSSSGTAGQIAYDGSYLYVCTTTNTWGRSSISSWDYDAYANNVVLLLHFNNALADASQYARTVTAYDNASATGTGKFGSGSLALDGSGDYLTVPAAPTLDLGNNYTVECWIYPNSSTLAGSVAHRGKYYTAGTYWDSLSFSIRGISTAIRFYFYATTSTNEQYIDISNSYFPANQWTHLAMVRSGTNGYVFANGQLVGTISSLNTSASSPEALYIGTWPYNLNGNATFAGYWDGLIDDLRITTVARYTSAFTAPTEAFPDPSNTVTPVDPYTSFVSILLPFDGNLTDYSSSPKTITAVGSASATATAKYGTASLALDGDGDGLTLSDGLPRGTEDFTVEFWIYKTSSWSGESNNRIIYEWADNALSGGVQCYVNSSSNTLRVGRYGQGDWYMDYNASNFSANTWYHIAVTRLNNTITLWVNGVAVQTSNYSGSFGSNSGLQSIGLGSYLGNYSASTSWPGRIDDFRVTRNFCRYTTTFIPPATAFPNP